MREPALCLQCGLELKASRDRVVKNAHADGLCADCWLTVPAVPGLVCTRCQHCASLHGRLTGRTPPAGASCRAPSCACIGGYSPSEES